MATKPNDFVLGYDTRMANLDVGTIWFQDGSFLNSANGIIGAAGGLSFQYTLNLNDTSSSPPISSNLDNGTLRFNSSNIADSTQIFISTNKRISSKDRRV